MSSTANRLNEPYFLRTRANSRISFKKIIKKAALYWLLYTEIRELYLQDVELLAARVLVDLQILRYYLIVKETQLQTFSDGFK